MTQPLKPCPLFACGGSAELVTNAPEVWIRCASCGLSTETAMFSDGLIKQWNARAPQENPGSARTGRTTRMLSAAIDRARISKKDIPVIIASGQKEDVLDAIRRLNSAGVVNKGASRVEFPGGGAMCLVDVFDPRVSVADGCVRGFSEKAFGDHYALQVFTRWLMDEITRYNDE